ncbi:MAG: hypothetical protein GY696_15225, partial [Gammaproteobacteria bacterium]|nr:hypothetical protein [Gammaproteobacteria bacterium]
MQTVLAGLEQEGTRVYLDDCLVFSETFEEHLAKLRKVFDRFRTYGLKLKLKKCHFAMSTLKFLGHIISADGLSPDPEKVRAVSEFPVPGSVTELRRFLGMIGYYRRFLPRFAQIARPLFNLMKKDQEFDMSGPALSSFDALKEALVKAPILCYPDERKGRAIETDASGYGLGAVLAQWDDGKLRPITYASWSMNSAERNYSATEQECLALVWSLKYFRSYVYGQKCHIYMDHSALRWLMSIKDPSGRLCRWSLMIQDFDLEIHYRTGASNKVADALSRAPLVARLGSTTESFQQAQRKDKQLAPIIQFLTEPDAERTEEDQNFLVSASKHYQLDGDGLLVLENGQNGNQRWVVPAGLKLQLLRQYHEDLGHFGMNKVQKSLSQKYYWMGMTADVQNHIRTCISCQKRKTPIPKPNPPLHSITIPGPFHTFAA